ncbi:MAG: hypothetical protein DI533_18360 [Cereibacter sphaeroides]|uniref:Cysteine rich repeat-containing protein n=1 Tax=Cereibacter sphaeroides TaxID=1063 RepID=A0A2W5TXW9_CERSP|nr:MAG: hypothetical protein DI533_18360 [Cereibacter sphaeroides]
MRIFIFAAVSTLLISPAFAADEAEALKTYCKPDIERLCHGVEPGNGALKKCLKDHEKDISVGCAEALKALKG